MTNRGMLSGMTTLVQRNVDNLEMMLRETLLVARTLRTEIAHQRTLKTLIGKVSLTWVELPLSDACALALAIAKKPLPTAALTEMLVKRGHLSVQGARRAAVDLVGNSMRQQRKRFRWDRKQQAWNLRS